MKLNIFEKVLFRIPQFPVNKTLEEAWPDLKRSIKDASVYFYNIIQDLEYADLAGQPQQVRFTIDKYFNRAKFRATPYGTFAGIGICKIAGEQPSTITIASKRKEHRFVDWKQTLKMQLLWQDLPPEQLTLQANDSYYRYRDTFRYIYKNEERFELSEMPFYPEIEAILKICSQTTSYTKLLEHADQIGLDQETILEITRELIESQLLFTNRHPNIIGEDYFKRIGQGESNADQEHYTICTHQTITGNLHSKDFEIIRQAVKFLHNHFSETASNPDLTTFIDKFRSKYDMQAIPLMQALDPVMGIGYGNMESEAGTLDLITKIASLKTDKQSSDQKNDLKQFLLHYQTSCRNRVIDLSDFKSKVDGHNLPLPNTLSALVTKADNLLVVEHLGGATATSLLGRFSLVAGEIHQLCSELAGIEKEANPGVIFFDIAYMGEPSVDNVNRRLSIYDYNISICCWNESGLKLRLDDIDVLIRGSDLILHSKSLNKRLIPRLSTAYNYSRSDLPLFRLLCDIQAQGIVTNLIPDLQAIIPNAEHYPRLMYKNVVLGREAWRIRYMPDFGQQSSFNDYLKGKQLSRFIKVGHADQTVRLDLEDQNQIDLLHSILKARTELLVSEVLTGTDAIIEDSEGNRFASELILSLFHKEQIYKSFRVNYEAPKIQRNFPPGSEWIYFNLFCSNSVSNEILIDHLGPVIHKIRAELAGWFFIRYNEGGDHIRLRLKPKNSYSYQSVFNKVSGMLLQLMDEGILRDIQLTTYKRELERYGNAEMEAIEAHFSFDSRYVLGLLNQNYSDIELHLIVVQCMTKVGTEVFGAQELSQIVKANLVGFQTEHATNSSVYKDLNHAYRKSLNMAAVMDFALSYSFVTVISKVDGGARIALFTDLFHMHINRLFPQHQRIHEYIIYEYLLLSLKQRLNPVMASS